MAGHSKWSQIKRSKGALDVKRGQIFSKLSKEISVAVRMGGGDADLNPRLRAAILAARAQNMPKDNIDRAIQKGCGETGGQNYEELIYEGYAPGGVAILLEVMTDNKNRTAADLRLIFSKNHGNLATSGSVSYMFHKKGQITVPLESINEDRLLEIALDAGAEELQQDEEHHIITTAHDALYLVADAVKGAGVEATSQKLTFIPDTTVPVADESVAAQVGRLCEALDDCDDVQNVHSNFEFRDESRLTA